MRNGEISGGGATCHLTYRSAEEQRITGVLPILEQIGKRIGTRPYGVAIAGKNYWAIKDCTGIFEPTAGVENIGFMQNLNWIVFQMFCDFVAKVMGVDDGLGNPAGVRECQCPIQQAFPSDRNQRLWEIRGEGLHATAKTGSK